MGETIYDFRSDNIDGAAPELLEALVAANVGTAAPYGDDDWTRGASSSAPVRSSNGPCVRSRSPAAPARILLHSRRSPTRSVPIYCHETAHINVHECGAPELFTGAKLVGSVRRRATS